MDAPFFLAQGLNILIVVLMALFTGHTILLRHRICVGTYTKIYHSKPGPTLFRKTVWLYT